LKLFGKELTLEQTIGFVRCQSPELTGDCKDCLMVQAAMDLISEVERLKVENTTLKKALELVRYDLYTESEFPVASTEYYIQKAQEQEAEK